ncbi:hypothetical protein OAS39_13120 [Pirellulales bacterium]|nr:hypothetical protein [Pirellulales bacterium]
MIENAKLLAVSVSADVTRDFTTSRNDCKPLITNSLEHIYVLQLSHNGMFLDAPRRQTIVMLRIVAKEDNLDVSAASCCRDGRCARASLRAILNDFRLTINLFTVAT